MALPPDDFQLFGTIFFVLLAIGLVLSVAFASALYFFHWYGRKKNGQQQMGENKAEIPIQWISYRGEGIGYNEKTIPSSQQFYSPYQQNDEEGRNAPRDHSKLLKKSFKELFADLVESIGRGCRILVSYLPGHGLSSSPSPSHTIFPTTMTIMRPPPSSPPSYISAQSPELVHFPKWANDAPKQLPSENSGKKLPKGILKKPKIHLNGNGRMPRPTMKRPPILMPMPIRRGTQSEIGRKPPPIPSQWKWNVKLEDGGHCERVVEDRIEREESCVQGKLVSIERVSRTTTTTKMLKEEATKMEKRRRMEDWPNSEKTIFI